jgi:phosphoglycolate phosphatase-like HAD superfamily hydrolase
VAVPEIDPLLSLAISVHSNKGVFALLLGSGVSRSAGVPTGSDIVRHLIRALAALTDQPCEPDEETWYVNTFGMRPNYSEILDQVAKSPAERALFLRRFFEPTEEERQEGRKQPTPAHRAIAELVAKGYIRAIVTTNFDRLTEQALADVGIQPVLISSADDAQGAIPLVHSRCTVVKVSGD